MPTPQDNRLGDWAIALRSTTLHSLAQQNAAHVDSVGTRSFYATPVRPQSFHSGRCMVPQNWSRSEGCPSYGFTRRLRVRPVIARERVAESGFSPNIIGHVLGDEWKKSG